MTFVFRIGAAAAALALTAGGALSDETGFADSHEQRREGGRLCLSDHAHSGYGEGKTKSSASAAAIKSWAEFTAFEYGTSWARYTLAAGKSTKFTKEAKGWSANIEARPCKG
jgi:hypothetical protein